MIRRNFFATKNADGSAFFFEQCHRALFVLRHADHRTFNGDKLPAGAVREEVGNMGEPIFWGVGAADVSPERVFENDRSAGGAANEAGSIDHVSGAGHGGRIQWCDAKWAGLVLDKERFPRPSEGYGAAHVNAVVHHPLGSVPGEFGAVANGPQEWIAGWL